jgi:hypothetical protein
MQGLPMKGPSPIWLVSQSYPQEKYQSHFLLAQSKIPRTIIRLL